MSRVLVTGGAGFIGSHLVDALAARGDEPVVLDSFDPFYDPAVKRANLRAGVELVQGDVRDPAAWARVGAVDGVVHLAARAGVRPSLLDPAGYADVNVVGTARALEFARDAGAAFVFASSSSVYGDDHPVPYAEDLAPAPVSPYGASKVAAEALVATWARLYGLRAVSLRFFTVYGPRQRPDLAIHKFARLILADAPLPMYGDGGAARDYTHVRDTVRGVLAALDRVGALPEPVYNLGSDRAIRLDTLIAALERALGRPARVDRLPMPQGDVQRTWADLSRARRDLGYDPQVAFDDGLADFAAWLAGHGPATGG